MTRSLIRFEQMLALAGEMLAAARANDWDLLGALEQQMASLRDELMREEPPGQQPEHLGDEALKRKAEIIAQTLALLAETREHTDPVLESTRKLLSGAVRDNNVRKAYGAFGP